MSKKSREYLEEAFSLAKEKLPGWAFAALVAEAKRRGRSKRLRNRALERRALETLKKEAKTDGELSLLESLEKEIGSVTGGHESPDPLDVSCVGELIVNKELSKCSEAVNKIIVTAQVTKADNGIVDLAISDGSGDFEEIANICDDREFPEGELVDYDIENQRILGTAKALAPDTLQDVVEKALNTTRTRPSLGFSGPETAQVLFVASHPKDLELARKEALVGKVSGYFKEHYLEPLGIEKEEAAYGFAVPVNDLNQFDHYDRDWSPWLEKQLAKYPCAYVVALGKYARQALGDKADLYLPHPSSISRKGASGEIKRKIKRLSKSLEESPKAPAADTSGRFVEIQKRQGEKRIAEGVVSIPWEIDAHGQFLTAAAVEEAAHRFMKERRVIKLQHRFNTTAVPVTSFIVEYPTPEDRLAALEGRPHNVLKRKFGNDIVTSGTWIMGVEFSEELWDLVLKGEITGFSIGALTMIAEVDPEMAIPMITIVGESQTGEVND